MDGAELAATTGDLDLTGWMNGANFEYATRNSYAGNKKNCVRIILVP